MKKPQTPEEWGLFVSSVSEDGPITQAALDRAAAALSTALDRAEAAVRAGTGAYEAYESFVGPVGAEYEDLGADDTEPHEAGVLYLMSISGEQP